jgi:hypothetical protein
MKQSITYFLIDRVDVLVGKPFKLVERQRNGNHINSTVATML